MSANLAASTTQLTSLRVSTDYLLLAPRAQSRGEVAESALGAGPGRTSITVASRRDVWPRRAMNVALAHSEPRGR
jgi:hypothetical protein